MDSRSIEFSEEFLKKELELGLYDIQIENFYVYGFLRRILRVLYADRGVANYTKAIKVTKAVKLRRFWYIIISYLQINWLKITKKKADTFVYSFYRVDRIGDKFVDKFTDPYIDNSSIKDSFIIFEKSKDFEHKRPRIHSDKTIYTDYIEYAGELYARKNKESYKSKHELELNLLWEKLDKLMAGVPYNRDAMVIRILRDMYMCSLYKEILVSLSVKRMFAPCRPVMLNPMYACKELGIPVLEVQHGGVSAGISFAGYQATMFTPDYFCAYGECENESMWSVGENRFFNIGWALPLYTKSIPTMDCVPTNILVVTNPAHTDAIIDAIRELAQENPKFHFYLRLHPIEKITEYLQKVLSEVSNIHLQDNRINITVALKSFNFVLGETSTVLLEALCLDKKIGRLYFSGLNPEYMKADESEYNWIIKDSASFNKYINDEPKSKYPNNVYSEYDKELFENLLSIAKVN